MAGWSRFCCCLICSSKRTNAVSSKVSVVVVLTLLGLLTSVLFDARQRYFELGESFDAVAVVEGTIAYLAYKQYVKECDTEYCQTVLDQQDACLDGKDPQDYLNEHLICPDRDDDGDDAIVQCATNYNVSDDENAAAQCLYSLFGVNASDPNLCDYENLKDQCVCACLPD